MDLYVKNDSKTFFINDIFDADKYFSSYLHKKCCVNNPNTNPNNSQQHKEKHEIKFEILVLI